MKNLLWASRLWVGGRRKDPVLGYVPKKKYEKKNSDSKGLNKMKIYQFDNPLLSSVPYMTRSVKILILI